jgi:ankyrin repeat protein
VSYEISQPTGTTIGSTSQNPLIQLNQQPVTNGGTKDGSLNQPAEAPESKDSALHRAAWHGRSAAIEVRIRRGDTVDATDDDGETPLQRAAWNGHLECALQLLMAGAEIDHKGGLYGSALEISSRRGHLEFVEFLLERGASNKEAALYAATKAGHAEIVRSLLEKDTPMAHEKTSIEPTLLHAAARSGNPGVVRCILDAGGHTDIVTANSKGETPLHIAATVGDAESFHLLLNDGADPFAVSSTEGSVLHHACASGRTQIVRSMIQEFTSINLNEPSLDRLPLIIACMGGSEDLVELLIAHGANVNQENDRGDCPLAAAIRCNHPKIALQLIHHGANVNQGSLPNSADSPLSAACIGGYPELLRAMLDRGADLRSLENRLKSSLIVFTTLGRLVTSKIPVLHARTKEETECLSENSIVWDDGHVNVVKFLLEHQVPLEVKGRSEETPLVELMGRLIAPRPPYVKLETGREKLMEIVRILILAGADINSTTLANASSCLHMFVTKYWSPQDLPDLLFLLNNGANIDQTDWDGRTPLIIAASHGKTAIMQQLLRFGADPSIKDKHGKTARTYFTAYVRRRDIATKAFSKEVGEFWLRQLQTYEESMRRKTELLGQQSIELDPNLSIALEEGLNDSGFDMDFWSGIDLRGSLGTPHLLGQHTSIGM